MVAPNIVKPHSSRTGEAFNAIGPNNIPEKCRQIATQTGHVVNQIMSASRNTVTHCYRQDATLYKKLP